MPEAVLNASIAYGNNSLRYPLALGTSLGGWEISILGRKPTRASFSPTSAVNQGVSEILNDWLEKKDPFTQSDLLDSQEDQIQQLIYQIKTSPSTPDRYRERLAKRLIILFNDAKEEDFASVGIVVGSLRNFYNFLQLHNDLRCPTISLTPEYNIYASWRAEQRRLFSVHFLPTAEARFVIFKPNDRHLERQVRLSGTATADILKETVAPYGVWDWISE